MRIRGISLLGDWKPAELAHLTRILDPLPRAWLEGNHHIKAFVRRPVLTDGPTDAPGHSKYDPVTGSIVVFDKGVYHGGRIDPEQFGRSVYHELAHSLLRQQPGLLDAWMHSTRGDGFVDDYARTGPDEDFADTFSEFFLHTIDVQKRFPRKAHFIRQLQAQGATEKIAMGFMNAFTDELVKTAAGGLGALKGLGEMALSKAKTPLGKGLIGASAVGGGGLAYGESRGKKRGLEQGTAQMDEGMTEAYKMGIRRGAQAMYQQFAQQAQSGEG